MKDALIPKTQGAVTIGLGSPKTPSRTFERGADFTHFTDNKQRLGREATA
jgi:hypothetical protein